MDPVSVAIGVSVGAAGYLVAYTRRGRVGSVTIGTRILEILTPGEPTAVFASIAAIGPPYKVDDQRAETLELVLSSRPSIWSYGFLYPVTIQPDAIGSRILVGVRSRFFHIGPGVGRAHTWCAQAIERLLTVPPARIA